MGTPVASAVATAVGGSSDYADADPNQPTIELLTCHLGVKPCTADQRVIDIITARDPRTTKTRHNFTPPTVCDTIFPEQGADKCRRILIGEFFDDDMMPLCSPDDADASELVAASISSVAASMLVVRVMDIVIWMRG